MEVFVIWGQELFLGSFLLMCKKRFNKEAAQDDDKNPQFAKKALETR
jgi:hypothetical protein